MLFPIKILEKAQKVEDLGFSNGVGYIVTRSGIYKRVKTALFEYLVKLDDSEGVDGLAEELKPTASTLTKVIPLELLRQIEAFFRKAYELYKGEAIVLLYYSPSKGEWMIRVPPQKVKGLHVSYDPSESPGEIDGFYLASSVHSHAAAGAFHSGTDDRDELEFDGLHITIGNVDKPSRSYAARWVLGRTVFTVKLGDVLETETSVLPEVPGSWMDQVSEQPMGPILGERNHIDPEKIRQWNRDLSNSKLAGSSDEWNGAFYSSLRYRDNYEGSVHDITGRKYDDNYLGRVGASNGNTVKPDKNKTNKDTGKMDDVYTERNVVADPFALVYDFEALLEGYES